MLRQESNQLVVIAASCSIAVPNGSSPPAPRDGPAFPRGVEPSGEPEVWLASPAVLAHHVLDDPAASLFGSDAHEVAVGPDAVREMLSKWKNVKLALGGVRVVDADHAMIVIGYARWSGAQPTLFRVLALFVLGGDSSWRLATTHYSFVPA